MNRPGVCASLLNRAKAAAFVHRRPESGTRSVARTVAQCDVDAHEGTSIIAAVRPGLSRDETRQLCRLWPAVAPMPDLYFEGRGIVAPGFTV